MKQRCRVMIPAQAPETKQSRLLFKKEYFKQSGICAVPDVNRDQRIRQRHYDKRRASRNRAERAEFVRGSYERYTEADRRVCITGKKMDCCQEMADGRNHADQCRKRGSVRSNPESLRLGMEKAKSENVVEHPVYGSEDMEELRQCRFDRSGRLHDKRPGDRRKGRSSLHDVPERRREVYYYQAHYNKLIFHL